MFTGIIEEVGRVSEARSGHLEVTADIVLQGMELGASIAVNGACLTVTTFDARSFAVDIMPETLRRTNLGQLRTGDKVNLERPLVVGGRLGGHFVQGHVDDTGRVSSMVREGEAIIARFEAPPEVMRYIVEKGFIAVDGVSLTVVDREASSFQVSLVDYTRRHTNLGDKRIGDLVNLEVDIMAKYVAQLTLTTNREGITLDFLKEHGFLVH